MRNPKLAFRSTERESLFTGVKRGGEGSGDDRR
jgi:hypothetical protein